MPSTNPPIPSFTPYFNLILNKNRIGHIRLQTVHLHVIHHPLLTLRKRQSNSPIRIVRSQSLSPTSPSSNSLKRPRGRLICLLRGPERATENFSEPGAEKVEDHGQVCCYDCDEGFAGAPFVSELSAIIWFLFMIKRG